MLTNIKLENFKCFERLDLDCRPLNLLCGLNGTGKSSVLQALLVLRQSFETGKLRDGEVVHGELPHGDERVDLGQGVDVLFEDADNEVVGFALQDDGAAGAWELDIECVPDRHSGSGFDVGLVGGSQQASQLMALFDSTKGPTWNDLSSNLKEVVTRIDKVIQIQKAKELARPDVWESLGPPLSEGYATARAEVKQLSEVLNNTKGPAETDRAALRGWLTRLFGSPVINEGHENIYDWLRGLLNSNMVPPIDYVPTEWRKVPPFGGELVYVNAERVGPRKSYPHSHVYVKEHDFGANSELAWSHLHNNQNVITLDANDPRLVELKSEGSLGPDLPQTVNHWLQEVSPSVRLQLEKVEATDEVVAKFSFDRPGGGKKRWYRATNVGFGLSYVLPVVLALLVEPDTLCLIENPESHLHPRGQTKLGELAARAAKAGVQVFVETHSDHFMDGVRIAVRDGLIAPEDVAFHYFERQGGKAVVSSPQVDADGRLSEWPAGFFDQHKENLVRLLTPRSRYARNGAEPH